MIHFILNGEKVEYDGDSNLTLQKYLRNQAGIMSVKDGCFPLHRRQSWMAWTVFLCLAARCVMTEASAICFEIVCHEHWN